MLPPSSIPLLPPRLPLPLSHSSLLYPTAPSPLHLPLLDSFHFLFFSSFSVFLFTIPSFVWFSSPFPVCRCTYQCRYFSFTYMYDSTITGTQLNRPSRKKDINPFPPNIVVQWLELLLRFWEILGSDHSPDTWLRSPSFSLAPVGKSAIDLSLYKDCFLLNPFQFIIH